MICLTSSKYRGEPLRVNFTPEMTGRGGTAIDFFVGFVFFFQRKASPGVPPEHG
jgi:hypothetical protein